MKLKEDYTTDRGSDYSMYTGGVVQTRWKSNYRMMAVLQLIGISTNGRLVKPVVYMGNNALLVVAFNVMRCWLESARDPYPQEEAETYLATTWQQALEAMGVPVKSGRSEETLTAEMLTRSPAMKKMKEDCGRCR